MQLVSDGSLAASSPRPWGCFSVTCANTTSCAVFPTPVGVFLCGRSPATLCRRLPHARGGVSDTGTRKIFWCESSPRPWGCFLGDQAARHPEHVFPTPVGVFPGDCNPYDLPHRLPHARGGVSVGGLSPGCLIWSSPRPWGCFSITGRKMPPKGVFPTPVGVFPPRGSSSESTARLPHARGGVSKVNREFRDTIRSSPRPWGCFRF